MKLQLGGFWLVLFVAIKLGSTALAAWSWWWLFLPPVPVLVWALQKLGAL